MLDQRSPKMILYFYTYQNLIQEIIKGSLIEFTMILHDQEHQLLP